MCGVHTLHFAQQLNEQCDGRMSTAPCVILYSRLLHCPDKLQVSPSCLTHGERPNKLSSHPPCNNVHPFMHQHAAPARSHTS